ncbi:hypothetical protein CTI12_AA423680 [Artemisia annua]|uniref:Uncharacterized protein n=1 Tax=Artemisia annua TaxID=35608 RepID=A0A2U1M3Y4_ARTAN|nr:hypothetical protein CTI12_AA423680 [Artemisia annua]
MEFFNEDRDLWNQFDSEYNWNFSNLQDAFEKEDGVLHEKNVYLFACSEPQLVYFRDKSAITRIPVVVAIVSPIPPSDKIGINSIQREYEEIHDMKKMNLEWVPYIPLGKRGSSVETLKSQIFILSCVKNRYPFDLTKYSVVCEYDWELDELEDFTKELIDNKKLPEDHKDTFKEFVKEKVREGTRAKLQATEKRKKALQKLNPEESAAFKSMRFYKFYPVDTPDTPAISNLKATFINRYYGHAHQVL